MDFYFLPSELNNDRDKIFFREKNIKIGVILGFTGPIESLTPPMGDGAEFAMKEVTDSGKLLGGASVTSVRADSTCIDAAAATAAAERLITSDGVKGIMGADCSGVTGRFWLMWHLLMV